MSVSQLKVFSHEMHEAFQDDLDVLGALKQLKYFFNLPIGQLFSALSKLYEPTPNCRQWKAAVVNIGHTDLAPLKVCDFLKENGLMKNYEDFVMEMQAKDPHAVFPTNIYRQCDGYTVSSKGKFEKLKVVPLDS